MKALTDGVATISMTSGAPLSMGNSGSNYPDFGYNMVRDGTSTQTYRSTDFAYRVTFGDASRMTFQYAASGTAGTNITWVTGFYIQNNGTMAFALPMTIADDATFSDGADQVFGTSTGSKLGTGTTQKLGFWNAAPVVQQTVTGSKAGGAALADLLTKLATIGIIVDGTSA